MPRPRRKSDIRIAALREVAALREAAEARAAFLKPRARSWHDLFLAALRDGEPIAAAARAARIARSTAHKARRNEPGFGDAWRSAYAHGLALRVERARLRNKARTAPSVQRRKETIQRTNGNARTV